MEDINKHKAFMNLESLDLKKKLFFIFSYLFFVTQGLEGDYDPWPMNGTSWSVENCSVNHLFTSYNL